MNGTAFLGMTGGPSEQLKRPCHWQYPKPQGPEKDCVTVALLLMALQALQKSSYHWPLAAGRAGGCQGGCSGWKSWYHTRPNSCRHWSLLRIPLWRLFTFQEKNPKTTKVFEKAVQSSCICLKKRTYSKQPMQVASAQTDSRKSRK